MFEGLTILRPEIRDWRMKTYLQMKWRSTHQGHIMELTNHPHIYFWLKISKYFRPHVEIKSLRNKKEGRATWSVIHQNGSNASSTLLSSRKRICLQNNRLPQSEKQTTTINSFFFTISKVFFQKTISFDMIRIVSLFFSPGHDLEKKNLVWPDT